MFVRMLCAVCVMAAAAEVNAAVFYYTYPGLGSYAVMTNEPANWTQALLICQKNNWHTVIIDSAAEAAAIREVMSAMSMTFTYLGFHDQFVEGKYNDVLGTPISSASDSGSHWAPGFPQGGTDFNCGGFTDAGFQDGRCGDEHLSFICEDAKKYPSYTLVPGFGFYNFHSESSSWTNAVETCKTEGAHLLVINSQEEIDALRSTFNLPPTFLVHVGVHRLHGGNDNFITVEDERLSDSGYDSWFVDVNNHPFGTFLTHPFVCYVEDELSKGLGTQTAADTRAFICEQY